MHARQQAEIAAWVAVNSAAFIASPKDIDGMLAEHYWTNSKARVSRWNAALKIFSQDFVNPSPDHNPWPAFEIIVEEIFLSEMLTRVWSTFLVSLDLKHGKEEFSGLAFSIFISHLEAKNRVLRMLLSNQGKYEAAFDRLNQLRRQVEKWTDLFLAMAPNQAVAQKFAFDKKRLVDFAHERGYYNDDQSTQQNQILINSMSRGFTTNFGKWSANPELNRRIIDGVLACIDQDTFDSHGLPKSLAQIWIEKAHSDAQVLVDQLNQLDNQTAASEPHFLPRKTK